MADSDGNHSVNYLILTMLLLLLPLKNVPKGPEEHHWFVYTVLDVTLDLLRDGIYTSSTI